MKKHMIMLLSLLPSSYMVAPIREVVNTLIPGTIKETTLNPIVYNTSNMDMDINTSSGRSASSSMNSLRVSSMYSAASSIPYYERMKIQRNNLPWNKQVEIYMRESFSLSYTTSKVGDSIPANETIDNSPKDGIQHANKKASVLNDMPILQGKCEASNKLTHVLFKVSQMF